MLDVKYREESYWSLPMRNEIVLFRSNSEKIRIVSFADLNQNVVQP
jgi:hypothetical protein